MYKSIPILIIIIKYISIQIKNKVNPVVVGSVVSVVVMHYWVMLICIPYIIRIINVHYRCGISHSNELCLVLGWIGASPNEWMLNPISFSVVHTSIAGIEVCIAKRKHMWPYKFILLLQLPHSESHAPPLVVPTFNSAPTS